MPLAAPVLSMGGRAKAAASLVLCSWGIIILPHGPKLNRTLIQAQATGAVVRRLVNLPDTRAGNTAIQLAVQNGHLDVARLLLSKVGSCAVVAVYQLSAWL